MTEEVKILQIEELIELTCKLINMESHIKCEHYELEVSNYIYTFLKKEGMDVKFQKADDSRFNVIAKLHGENSDLLPIVFTGHIDTVESYGHLELFKAKVSDGQIYGRGACDMKGPIAAMIMAAVAIKRQNIKLKRDVILAFVVDEEYKSIGTEKLIEEGIKAECAILGEPTNMQIAVGNRGLEWIDIEVIGKGTHGGTPEKGINSVVNAAKLIMKIENELKPKIAAVTHPVLGNSIMNIGMIEGGNQPSTVPEKCLIKIDRRWIWPETIETIYKQYEDIIDELHKEDNNFNAKVIRNYSNMNNLDHLPVYIESSHAIVKNLIFYSEQVTNGTPNITLFPGWSDASLLGNFGKIPTVIFGPGDISKAHSDKESISIEELYNASAIYLKIMINY